MLVDMCMLVDLIARPGKQLMPSTMQQCSNSICINDDNIHRSDCKGWMQWITPHVQYQLIYSLLYHLSDYILYSLILQSDNEVNVLPICAAWGRRKGLRALIITSLIRSTSCW